jgi:phosphatidylserine decarboxylase
MIRNQPAIYPPSQAVRTALDVYGENVRKIVPIDSPAFGCVMAVCVGAMMVGSIHTPYYSQRRGARQARPGVRILCIRYVLPNRKPNLQL